MENYLGKIIDDRYHIKQIIGVGGMAVVYKALDLEKKTEVAIKILKDEYKSDVQFRRRFSIESQAIAMLDHPNIVSVYDVSLSGDTQYLVMELIHGITLKQYIDHQKILTWKMAVHFTTQILKALSCAHQNGIVHRDIKPHNIMLLQDGNIKVTDFGIARFASSDTQTMTDKAIGSVHYISPEQASGRHTDKRSDIYSTGVMLYEMVTGRLPFEADSAVSVAIMQLQTTPVMPREINPSIPEGLQDIIIKAMTKDPSLRYQTADEMLSDIEKFKANPSIQFEYKYFVDESPTQHFDKIKNFNGQQFIEGSDDMKSKRRSMVPVFTGIVAAFVFVIIAVLVFILIVSPGTFGFGKNPDIPVPNLVGRTVDDVKSDPDLSVFKFVEGISEFSDRYPEGTIMSHDPPEGMKVKENSEIRLTVSKGKRTVVIPEVINKSSRDAQIQLQKLGFIVNEVPQFDDNIVQGYVIKTDPAPGESLSYGGTVTVYVSKGKEVKVVKVPKLIGYTEAEAKKAIIDANLVVGKVNPIESNSKPGTVLAQNPAADTDVNEGTTVDIDVSSGPKQTTVTRTLILPAGKESYLVKVVKNGTVVYEKVRSYYENPLTFTFTGSGTDNIDYYLDGILYDSEVIVYNQDQ